MEEVNKNLQTQLTSLNNEGWWARARYGSLIGVVWMNALVMSGLAYGLVTRRLNPLEPLNILSYKISIPTTFCGSFAITATYMLYVLRKSCLPAGPLLQYLKEKSATGKTISEKEESAIDSYARHVEVLSLQENQLSALSQLHHFRFLKELRIKLRHQGKSFIS
jgi:hypothetical protein